MLLLKMPVTIKIRLEFRVMATAFRCRGYIRTAKPKMKFMIELILFSDMLVTNLAGTYELSDCSKLLFIHNTFKSCWFLDGVGEGLAVASGGRLV
jgi:hypothetical protein